MSGDTGRGTDSSRHETKPLVLIAGEDPVSVRAVFVFSGEPRGEQMEGLRRSMERGAIDGAGDDGGWQKTVIAALGAIVLLVAGWVWADAQQTKTETSKTIQQFGERLATQEEAMRGVRDTLIRIENGVNELRRERK